RARQVGVTRRVLVASPAYLAAHKRLKKPEDLRGHSLIQFASVSPLSEWRFQQRSKVSRVPFKPRFVTNSADAALQYAEKGGGITMVLGYQARERVKANKLEVVLPRYETTPLPIQLVYLGSRLHSANLRAFIELASTHAKWDFSDL